MNILLNITNHNLRNSIVNGLKNLNLNVEIRYDKNKKYDYLINEGCFSAYKINRKNIFEFFNPKNVFVLDRGIIDHNKIRISRCWNTPLNRMVFTKKIKNQKFKKENFKKFHFLENLKSVETLGLIFQPPFTASVLPLANFSTSRNNEIITNCYIELLNKFYSSNLKKIIFKFHPGKPHEQKEIFLKLKNAFPEIKFINEGNLDNLIENSEVIIGLSSLALIKAFLKGKPIYSFSRSSWSYPLNCDNNDLDKKIEWLEICYNSTFSRDNEFDNPQIWENLLDYSNYDDISHYGIPEPPKSY